MLSANVRVASGRHTVASRTVLYAMCATVAVAALCGAEEVVIASASSRPFRDTGDAQTPIGQQSKTARFALKVKFFNSYSPDD